MATKIPGYYTVTEAMPILKLGRCSICRYVRLGQLDGINLGPGRMVLVEQGAAHTFRPNPRGNPEFKKNQKS